MATEEDSIHADQEEPNLLEINEMLVDIQISITSVVKENKALRKERSQRQRQFQREGTPRLERVVAKDKRRNKVLHRNLLDATKTRKKKRQGKILRHNMKEESDRLCEELDSLEQYTRKNSLEIRGIPD